MSKGQWIILYIEHTTSTTYQPTNLCISSVCQEQGQYPERCSLQIKKASSISISTSIAPDVWINTSSTTAVPSGIIVIYPGEAPRTITPQTSIHKLWLQPAFSASSQHFHLPPCYQSHDITINISCNTSNLHVVNMSALECRIWQHLEDQWNRTLLHHIINIPWTETQEIQKLLYNMVSLTVLPNCPCFYG